MQFKANTSDIGATSQRLEQATSARLAGRKNLSLSAQKTEILPFGDNLFLIDSRAFIFHRYPVPFLRLPRTVGWLLRNNVDSEAFKFFIIFVFRCRNPEEGTTKQTYDHDIGKSLHFPQLIVPNRRARDRSTGVCVVALTVVLQIVTTSSVPTVRLKSVPRRMSLACYAHIIGLLLAGRVGLFRASFGNQATRLRRA